VSWSANKLTLNAQTNININTAMNGSGAASLALEYGQGAAAAGNASAVNVRAPINLPAGQNFSTKQGANGALTNYTVITSLGAAGSVTGTDLQGINGNLSANYVLGNIDALPTSECRGGFALTTVTTVYGKFDGLVTSFPPASSVHRSPWSACWEHRCAQLSGWSGVMGDRVGAGKPRRGQYYFTGNLTTTVGRAGGLWQ
jgi:hypothetical protein